MKKFLYIIPECYIDTNLISTLTGGSVNHQKGCNNVGKVMKEKFSNSFAVGIIDNDKREPGYIDDFEEIAQCNHLTLLKHKKLSHYFITIKPAVDKFILDCASEIKVDVKDFGYSQNLKRFTAKTKKVTANNDVNFSQLFKVLTSSKEFVVLSKILTHFIDNQYNSDTNSLISIFNNS